MNISVSASVRLRFVDRFVQIKVKCRLKFVYSKRGRRSVVLRDRGGRRVTERSLDDGDHDLDLLRAGRRLAVVLPRDGDLLALPWDADRDLQSSQIKQSNHREQTSAPAPESRSDELDQTLHYRDVRMTNVF